MQAQNKVYMWARSHGSPVEEEEFHKKKKKKDIVKFAPMQYTCFEMLSMLILQISRRQSEIWATRVNKSDTDDILCV